MKANIFYRNPLRKTLVLLLLLTCVLTNRLSAQQKNKYIDSVIVNKAFPFIAFLQETPEVLKMVQNDPDLMKQGLQQKERIVLVLKQCKDVDCYTTSVQWPQNEIIAIGNDLIKLNEKREEFRQLMSKLKASGYYNVFEPYHDTAFIRAVWNSVALGINQALDVYIKGKSPSYPAIDAISIPEGDEKFRMAVHNMLTNEINKIQNKTFFEISLNSVLEALRMNQRDEASCYEPLNNGMNKSAFESIPTTKWDKYRYSAILVPGEGPEQEGANIDPIGIYRCKLATKSFKEGLAPFIIVSGGHVHPNKTPFCEAEEMKKYMVKELNIPEQAIIIEPHARHTTTNMRNAARIVYRFKIPDNKKILITTDSNQNAFILSMEMRFMKELGCVPYRDLKKLSEESCEFYPVRNALQCNALDPLDP